MKHLLVLFLVFTQGFLFANMREPVIHGTMSSRPFTSEFVDILHEELNITLDASFSTATFEIIYTIQSAKMGQQVPLLFYAIDYSGDFEVSIDGKRIDNIVLPNYDFVDNDSLAFDFAYFNEKSTSHDGFLPVNTAEGQSELVDFARLIYFKTDIPEGQHQIKVTYNAAVWVDMWNPIKEYAFKYSLSPAEFWRSFGVLDITIDASAFDEAIETNLGGVKSGDLNNVGHWSFEGIPVPVLEIYYHPEISGTAQFFLDLGGLNMALIIGFIFAVLHLVWVYYYRRKHPQKKFSIAVIVGALLVPLIFIMTWVFSFDWFEYLIGPDASEDYSYRILAFVGYPILLIPYWLIAWGFDKVDKRKLQQKEGE